MSKNKPKNKNKAVTSKIELPLLFDLFICLVIVSLLFIPALSRQWLLYDERIIFDGLYFPTPSSFGEIFEIIEKFGLNFNVISSNSIYSSNYVRRTCPFGELLGIFANFFFKRQPFPYHTFCFTLHIINTCIFYFILRFCFKNNISKWINRTMIILLTLLWAIHPVMVEPVVLATNFGATFSYIFFFSFLLDFLINREKNNSNLRRAIIPILFLIPMLTNEYIITLPFVLFVISFYFTYQNNSLKDALKKTFIEVLPYFIGFFLYLIYFLFLSGYQVSKIPVNNQFIVSLERVFWLSPQIFFHFIKLLLYPKTLSIDQTLFLHLGKTLNEPYSIFCILFLSLWLFIPLFLFLSKKKFPNIFLISWTFFFALLPYLHILMPSYTLAAERYLYAPLALLIFGTAIVFSRDIARNVPTYAKFSSTFFLAIIISALSIILIFSFIRAQRRTLDWMDNYAFINSSYKTSKDPLFKAMRLGMLGKAVTMFEPNEKAKSQEFFAETIELLQEARKDTLKKKQKYQKDLPLVIKAYGLDYKSTLAKIAYLEASSRCLELNEHYSIGLKILEPFMKNPKKLDPRIFELYTHLLVLDNRKEEAKELLLEANRIHPNISFILLTLFDLSTKIEKDKASAEKYLLEALKSFPYDISVLLKAVNFYQEQNNLPLAAKYAYLYGLRIQSNLGYQQALSNYLALDDLKNAKKVADKLLKIDSNNPETLYFVSKYYYKSKEYEKALSILTNAYSISIQVGGNPKSTFDIGYTLAKLYLYLGNQNQAILISQNISPFANGHVDALYKLADLYKSLGLTQNLNDCIKRIQVLKH